MYKRTNLKHTLNLPFAFILTLILCPLANAEGGKFWQELPDSTSAQLAATLPSLAPIIEKTSPAVVNISIEGKEKVQALFSIPGGDVGGLPEQFSEQQERAFKSLGSGFMIHKDGYVVTNNHVVEHATKIIVRFQNDKKTYKASVVGQDKKTDIALIKIDNPPSIAPVPLGDSSIVKPGDWVLAIGNPFTLGHTSTVGIVSAKSRQIGGPYDDYIQTDASINQGNSGGPLLNMRGEVIGVNSAILSPDSGRMRASNVGIGFAIPVNIVKSIVSQLHEKGSVTRGWLGVLIQSVDEDLASALKLPDAKGALVAEVAPDGPAAKAGIAKRDVIVEFDGKKIDENDQLPLVVAETPVGKKVEVVLFRKGQKMSLSVEIKELTDRAVVQKQEVSPDEYKNLGMSVQELTPDIADALGAGDAKGVVVTLVEPEGLAGKAGVRRGDIILEIGSEAVVSLPQFKDVVSKLNLKSPVLLSLQRGENTFFLTVKEDTE